LLLDGECKWFVAAIFFEGAPVPKRLLKSILRAAIYEVNPSLDKYLVLPCVESHGHRCVNELLLDIVESGTDFEKAGAVNALYWAQMSVTYPPNTINFGFENATQQSRDAYSKLNDVWERRRRLFLCEFVSNDSIDVRRSIIPSLKLDEAVYPDDLKPLVAEATQLPATTRTITSVTVPRSNLETKS
jgi:hypothetical protein